MNREEAQVLLSCCLSGGTIDFQEASFIAAKEDNAPLMEAVFLLSPLSISDDILRARVKTIFRERSREVLALFCRLGWKALPKSLNYLLREFRDHMDWEFFDFAKELAGGFVEERGNAFLVMDGIFTAGIDSSVSYINFALEFFSRYPEFSAEGIAYHIFQYRNPLADLFRRAIEIDPVCRELNPDKVLKRVAGIAGYAGMYEKVEDCFNSETISRYGDRLISLGMLDKFHHDAFKRRVLEAARSKPAKT